MTTLRVVMWGIHDEGKKIQISFNTILIKTVMGIQKILSSGMDLIDPVERVILIRKFFLSGHICVLTLARLAP